MICRGRASVGRLILILLMEATLIFPHQLFRPHPAVKAGRSIWLLEDPLFWGNDRHWPFRFHVQKRVLHRATLVEFTAELEAAGHPVVHVRANAGPTTTAEMLERALPRTVTRLHVVDPVDDVLHRRLTRFASARQIELIWHESPNFLSPPDFRASHFGSERKPFLARFYAEQRQRLGLLMEANGSPRGGRWSFDTENRRRLGPRVEIPPVRFPPAHGSVSEAIKEITADFPDSRGECTRFDYPVTRRDARAWLDDFLNWRLHGFGDYEDAISEQHGILFHSVLTPALNLGLLHPHEVVTRAIAAAEAQQIPLNSIEGFVRQLIGWREFIRCAYEVRGVVMRTANFWRFTRRMPAAFYSGTTGIDPVDHVIRRVLATGWCHHIERLMILGNFMLLCRIRPDDVYQWFMELFVDAYDWVMVPNVYGMSQFSDGGSFTTKPYLSASSYVLKMSDFPRGPWCDTWDALFWTFIADHRDVFEANPRLRPMTLQVDRIGAKIQTHKSRAENFLARLEGGAEGPLT